MPKTSLVCIVLQDLLFSACGLSILSTIICTLSTVTCSIHIFSLDLIHLVSTNAAHFQLNLQPFFYNDKYLTNQTYSYL